MLFYPVIRLCLIDSKIKRSPNSAGREKKSFDLKKCSLIKSHSLCLEKFGLKKEFQKNWVSKKVSVLVSKIFVLKHVSVLVLKTFCLKKSLGIDLKNIWSPRSLSFSLE